MESQEQRPDLNGQGVRHLSGARRIFEMQRHLVLCSKSTMSSPQGPVHGNAGRSVEQNLIKADR